ncbi:hypothetical protein EVAR_16849_1 [Eumeta japonica]|uniref:Uncharacterized protein n=1 Tax=Eumeta variegata TaxID=151549 RepID=A0A4C1V2Y0_EUMVA|nr:hypothetical protein EVAR_16849_1 [Eumeta japonica]
MRTRNTEVINNSTGQLTVVGGAVRDDQHQRSQLSSIALLSRQSNTLRHTQSVVELRLNASLTLPTNPNADSPRGERAVNSRTFELQLERRVFVSGPVAMDFSKLEYDAPFIRQYRSLTARERTSRKNPRFERK